MASNRFYIPNANEFFEGLLSLLHQCGDCLNENTDGGHAEFLARRLEEYQRTLRVMYGRVTESVQGNRSAYPRFGTFNAGSGLQITITCNTIQ